MTALVLALAARGAHYPLLSAAVTLPSGWWDHTISRLVSTFMAVFVALVDLCFACSAVAGIGCIWVLRILAEKLALRRTIPVSPGI